MKVLLNEAIEILNSNNVVAIPTETVYGLGAKIDSQEALKKIFETKERPFFDPLIIHISNTQMLAQIFKTNKTIETLIEKFWPGPLTIISKKLETISPLISAGLPAVGVRMPSHPLTLSLIESLGVPLAAPSANKFKKTSPTCAQHVLDDFDSCVPVLDGGQSQLGIESTVLEVFESSVKIYRQGLVTKEDIQNVLPKATIELASSNVSPGTMKDHYQPKIPLYIIKGSTHGPQATGVELKLDQDPYLAARNLYVQMRYLASQTYPYIYIDQDKYPKDSLWSSIWDRIEKSSTKN